ncbi:hypothetical protein GCM10027292_01190 [Hydrogenophaga aquatica]
MSGTWWSLKAIKQWLGSRVVGVLQPYGRDLVQVRQPHGQGMGVIVGVIARVVCVTDVGRRNVVLMAVAMPVVH